MSTSLRLSTSCRLASGSTLELLGRRPSEGRIGVRDGDQPDVRHGLVVGHAEPSELAAADKCIAECLIRHGERPPCARPAERAFSNYWRVDGRSQPGHAAGPRAIGT